jgi:hypothetical protein
VDPGSPAGKEYQIPVVGARNETAGGTQGQSANPPLFGVGVTPATHAPASSSAGHRAATVSGSRSVSSSSTRSAGSDAKSGSQRVASSGPAGNVPVSAVGPPASGGSSSGAAGGNGWIALVAGGLLVLVLGGGGGLLLRQRVARS